jgi:hypothetical protein
MSAKEREVGEIIKAFVGHLPEHRSCGCEGILDGAVV